MPLNEFFLRSINALLTNKEALIEQLGKVEKGLAEVKLVLHGMGRFKTTARRFIKTVVEEEDDKATEEWREEDRS